MKKYLNFSVLTAMLLVMVCVGFSSCDKDDDEGVSNSKNKIEFYLDGKLMPWYALVDGYDSDDIENNYGNTMAYYHTKNKRFSLFIHLDKINPRHWFSMDIAKDINELKIGDNILDYNYIDYQEQIIHKYVDADYCSGDWEDDYYLGEWNPWYGTDYPKNNGSIVIKNIDTTKQLISFEIKDLLVWKYKYNYPEREKDNSKIEHIIKANIEMYYILE